MGMMRSALGLAVLLCGLAGPALAEEGAADGQARWAELKHDLFGSRNVVEDAPVVALDAPSRALDAAIVPIGVTLPGDATAMSGRVKTLWLLVDGNPSPLVGVFHFGPAADLHSFRTRVRVDQYTLIHAVVETTDGRLFSASRFVKAAGGCSAPSSKDPEEAMSRLGRMKLRRIANGPAAAADGATQVELLISHPNNNGMQMDQVTHNYIPPRYIQSIRVRSGNETVFDAETDISLSEDPALTFGVKAAGEGKLQVDVEDSSHAEFHGAFGVLDRS